MNVHPNEDPGKTESQEMAKEAEQKPARKRLYWVDWCRSQSVYNVVCGHIWWDVRDEFSLTYDNVYASDWSESTRIMEYSVDEGTFHTIPMFFLVSGYLTHVTLKIDSIGVKKFLRNRVLRIIPPFIFGAIVQVIVQCVGRGKSFSIGLVLFSHLWFLWALALIQLATLPFCVMARSLTDDAKLLYSQALMVDATHRKGPLWSEEKKKMFWMMLGINVVFNVVFAVVMELMFGLLDKGRGAWLFGLPFASNVPILLFVLANIVLKATKNVLFADILFMAGGALCPLSTFLFFGVNSVCSVEECGRFSFLSQNLNYSLNIIVICSLSGFVFGELQPMFQRILAATKLHELLGILGLLFSCFWPYFTYWAPQYIRTTGFLMTYQEFPKIALAGPYNSTHPDPAMTAGLAPSWAIARMWFWSLLICLFAKAYANYAFHKKFHVHITQSGMILYIFHRFYDVSLAEAMISGGMTDPATVTYALIAATFALCFLTYAVVMTNKFTRAMFGIVNV
jgi:hypothetical protein